MRDWSGVGWIELDANAGLASSAEIREVGMIRMCRGLEVRPFGWMVVMQFNPLPLGENLRFVAG